MRPRDDEDAFAYLVPPTIECNALMIVRETVPYTNTELLARWRALALDAFRNHRGRTGPDAEVFRVRAGVPSRSRFQRNERAVPHAAKKGPV